jgi:hypothetical protein
MIRVLGRRARPRNFFVEKGMRKIVFLELFSMCILLVSCFASQKQQIEIRESIADENINEMNEDEMLREQYANEIILANIVIDELENYYTLNNSFPKATDCYINAFEENITEKAGMVFDYVWLDTKYVLCYWLPDGTGLLYFSSTKLWTITENIP